MDSFIASLLSLYQLPAIFLGSFFFGETVIITAAFLASQGIWRLTEVFWLSLAGTVISDSLWFLFGQSIFKVTRRQRTYQSKYQGFFRSLESATGQSLFLSLLFIKFLYGTRILTILYLSIRKIRFWMFLAFDTVGTMFWLTVIILIGWLAGKGVTNVLPIARQTEYLLSAIVLFIILHKIITLWLTKKITKK